MKYLFRFLMVSLLIASCAVRAESCADPRTLRLAIIPKKNAETQVQQYRPLVRYLERSLARPVEVVPANSYGAVIEGLLAGTVDLAELGPASYAIAKARDSGITAFASFALKKGPYTPSGGDYHSLLIVSRDRNFNSPADLRGKTLGLIDPASTSGTLIPRRNFTALIGVPLESFFRRISFTGSHDRAIQAVQRRQLDAAFVSSSRLDEALRSGAIASGELAVLWKSPPIPYDPFVYRGPLCPELKDRIAKAFLANDAALRGFFLDLQMDGFVAVDDERYREIRDLYGERP